VLRLIQEEAMKDKTGRVVAQLPVKVATFLLNEKRDAIRAIEQRLRVGVLLIPNESLETPHFKLNRLRIEELSEAQRLSYTLAEDYEEQYASPASTAARELSEEPAVKGVAPSTPAPLPPPAPAAKPEANPGFFRWVWSNLFGLPAPTPPAKEERPARAGGRMAKPEKPRRERPGRRAEAEPVAEAPAVGKPVVAAPVAETAPAPMETGLPELPPMPEPVVISVEERAEETIETAETEEEGASNRNRRGRRGGRRRRRETTGEAVPAEAETTLESEAAPVAAAPPREAVASIPPSIPVGATPQRRIRSGRPRLPREILAAAAAEAADKESITAPPEIVPATVAALPDELPIPPLLRLEYPVPDDEPETPPAAPVILAADQVETVAEPLELPTRLDESSEPPESPVPEVEAALPDIAPEAEAMVSGTTSAESAIAEAPPVESPAVAEAPQAAGAEPAAAEALAEELPSAVPEMASAVSAATEESPAKRPESPPETAPADAEPVAEEPPPAHPVGAA
jgi:ribonuclease E